MASDPRSDHKENLDQVFASAWAILLSPTSRIFTIKDIKALRLTCKLMNQLSTPLITRLSIRIDKLFEEPAWSDSEAGSDSEADSDSDCQQSGTGTGTKTKKPDIEADADPEAAAALIKGMVFPPLWETIHSLTINGDDSDYSDCCEDEFNPWSSKSFGLVMKRATNLKRLVLLEAKSLTFFKDAPLPSLETLMISYSTIHGDLLLPSSLVHLELYRTTFNSPAAAVQLFTSGTLPNLRSLHANFMIIGRDYDNMIKLKMIMRDQESSAEEDPDPAPAAAAAAAAAAAVEAAAAAAAASVEAAAAAAAPLPTNWLQIMSKMNLPSLESLSLMYIPGLSVTDAFRIGAVAQNLPRLKEYKAPFYAYSQYDSMWPTTDLDVAIAANFFKSSICAGIENLDLIGMLLYNKGFEVLVKHASNMPCLKTLAVDGIDTHKIGMMAEAGALGGWPSLQNLMVCIYAKDSNPAELPNNYRTKVAWYNHCKSKLGPVWPSLNCIRIAKAEILSSTEFENEFSLFTCV
ncbi:hypothetical protein Ndes2526B_g08946 [Nannochloris sp. 'desiccata']